MSELLSVNVNDDCAEVLRCERAKGASATESVRRAISLLAFFTEQAERGAKVFLEAADGTRQEFVLRHITRGDA